MLIKLTLLASAFWFIYWLDAKLASPFAGRFVFALGLHCPSLKLQSEAFSVQADFASE